MNQAADNFISVHEHLHNLRSSLGEEAWRAEIRRLAKAGIKMGGKHEVFWREFVSELDWINADDLKNEPDGPGDFKSKQDPNRALVEAMRQSMPGLKSQAQFNAFMAAFDALRMLMNSLFEGRHSDMLEAKKALESAIDVAARVTEVTDKLHDVPEAATGKAADEFKQAPAQFHEYDVQKELLLELAGIHTAESLTTWYGETKERRDRIVSQSLRNTLMDAIREKKLSFS